MDIVSNFRNLHDMALVQATATKIEPAARRGYMRVAHEALTGMVKAVEAMPDLDGTPPLVPTEEPVKGKRVRRMRAAEPNDQTQVRLTAVTIHNHANGKPTRNITPVAGESADGGEDAG